jgi:hypothetical protein
MAHRLIRDSMLDSDRVQFLPLEGRWLFVTMLLQADDLGLLELNGYLLSRKANMDANVVNSMLTLLADADLIRVYEVSGKRYAFIPRFRQRLQIKRSRHPLPPSSLMSDDTDALNKINNLGSNPRLDNGAPRLSTCVQPPEPEPEPELIHKVPTVLAASAKPSQPAAAPFDGENAGQIPARALVVLASSWELPEAWGLDAEALGWKRGDIIIESERFKQYWTVGRGSGKRRTVKGWRQAWSNWLAKAAERKR